MKGPVDNHNNHDDVYDNDDDHDDDDDFVPVYLLYSTFFQLFTQIISFLLINLTFQFP